MYSVTARFTISQPGTVALAVLSDYEQIPRFMPDVRTSEVLERHESGVIVKQEAVARLMMFSKNIHLVLEIQEHTGGIRFRDRCGTSFVRYEGEWRVTDADGRAAIEYELTAQPAFAVPEFVLKRQFEKNATRMIEQLRAEIAARSPQGRAGGPRASAW